MSVAPSRVRLLWPGKSAAPPPAPARLELVAPGHPACMLIAGDNLLALQALRHRVRAGVTLAYLDPPFFTGRQHAKVHRSRDAESGRVVRDLEPAFDDRWGGLDEYLAALHGRIVATRTLLAPHGSLVVHVDPKTSHYVKVMCDEIFGLECFASEIVWRYRRWPSRTQNFQRLHDVLLRYVRDPSAPPRFNQHYEPLAPSTLATWGDRKQRAVVDASGRRCRSSSTAEPTPGTPLGDVWEIGIVAPVARERTGYPTQKPEALLQRLIETCTNPGDLVVDPYAGSGTTLAVGARLERRVVGIDSSPQALETIRARLLGHGIHPLEERVTTSEGARPARPRLAG